MALIAESALHADLDGGTAGDRYQVVVHVDGGSIGAPAQTAIELDEGAVRVSAETSRRLACDAALVVIREGPDGSVMDVGRRTRTVPTPIRRALTARDARCRFQGHGAPLRVTTTSPTGRTEVRRRSTI